MTEAEFKAAHAAKKAAAARVRAIKKELDAARAELARSAA